MIILIITEETLNKIKESADIVKIISEYVKLEKKGGNFVGLCPFHPDTNPSMSVSPAKGIYKCFSCGASGNVITFVQNYEHLSFVKAVQVVGEKVGIHVELNNAEFSQNLDKYHDILQKALNFYDFYLKNTTDGKDAIEYLYKRHLNDEIIKRFKIGLSPKEPDLLYKSLLNDKVQPLDMIESGLIRSGKNYYDVFRNRIMFPIEDINGKIVGFSGRIYHQQKTDESKYLNSSENIVFKKGNILYNYRQAINEIKMKDKVFVFEGFMDVIAAYRAEVYNTIATMGTALTQNQIKAILKTTNNVVLCYDGDYAGIEATKKAIFSFVDAKCNVSAVLMPEGIDPDEYINQYGKEKLYDFLHNHAISGIDYLYEVDKRSLNLSDLNTIEKFKNNIFNYLKFYNSTVVTEKILTKLAIDLKISIESINLDFKNKRPVYKEDFIKPELPTEIKLIRTQKHLKKKYLNAEKALIKAMYYSCENCKKVEELLFAKCVDKKNRDIYINLYNYYSRYNEMNDDLFKSTLTPAQIEIVNEILNDTTNTYTEIDLLIGTISTYQREKELEDYIEKNRDNLNNPEVLENIRQMKMKIINDKNK